MRKYCLRNGRSGTYGPAKRVHKLYQDLFKGQPSGQAPVEQSGGQPPSSACTLSLFNDLLPDRGGVNGLTRYPAGPRPVYAAGDLVLKLFPPVTGWPGQRIEARVLAAVAGQLPVPTPRVHASGNTTGGVTCR
jgi:hypothetical protein